MRPPADALVLGDGTVVRLSFAADGTIDGGAAITAVDDQGRAIGHVAYARVYGPRALVTVGVDEGSWHRGLPELLLASLCVHAACVGISTFLMRAGAADLRLLALLREQFAANTYRNGPSVDVEFSTAVHTRSGWSTDGGAAVRTDGGGRPRA